MIEEKLNKISKSWNLSTEAKDRVWQAVAKKTTERRSFFAMIFESTLVPKLVASALLVAMVFTVLPELKNQITPSLVVRYVFGESYVVRASNYIYVEGDVPLVVGDYVYVKDNAQAKIISSKGYEMVLSPNSVLEVSPRISIGTVKDANLAFDEFTLNLHSGQILGNTYNVVKSPIPIIASGRVVYSNDKGVFSISIDGKKNIDIRSLSGVLNIDKDPGSSVNAMADSGVGGLTSKLIAGYNISTSKQTGHLVLARDTKTSQKAVSTGTDTTKTDVSVEEKKIFSDDISADLNQRMLFLNVKLNQAVSNMAMTLDTKDVSVWTDIATRFVEIADISGLQLDASQYKFTDVYSALSNLPISNLNSYISTEYSQDDRTAKDIKAFLSLFQKVTKGFADSLVQNVNLGLSKSAGFAKLPLNLKMAGALYNTLDFVLDARDKKVVKTYADQLIAEGAAKVLGYNGDERIKYMEALVANLSDTELKQLRDLVQAALPPEYGIFFN